MNLKDTLQILCSSGKGLTKSMVSVDWSDNYNMKSHPTFHQLIDELWTERSKSSVRLFNASKFRFHQIKIDQTDDTIANIQFLLGTTSYKEFIGTNCASFADKLVIDGITDFSNSQAYMSDPLGVGGILETDDKNIVFIRRSNICAEMPGLIDRPGGHPEPEEVLSKFSTNNQALDSSKVVDEIFDSVQKEIRDEINIPIEKLSSPLLLGISHNPKTWKRPSLEFYVRCYLTSKEVLDLYSRQTQAESEESTDLIIVPLSDILDYDNFKKWPHYSELTHAAQSAIYCLQIFFAKVTT